MTKVDRQSSLEHEIEATRERLAGTIDQLLYRSSPKTIAQRQIAAVKATGHVAKLRRDLALA